MKLVLTVLVLSLPPVAVFAEGCSSMHPKEQASNCAAGQIWDSATGRCTPASS